MGLPGRLGSLLPGGTGEFAVHRDAAPAVPARRGLMSWPAHLRASPTLGCDDRPRRQSLVSHQPLPSVLYAFRTHKSGKTGREITGRAYKVNRSD
jgi:hypothetical protein